MCKVKRGYISVGLLSVASIILSVNVVYWQARCDAIATRYEKRGDEMGHLWAILVTERQKMQKKQEQSIQMREQFASDYSVTARIFGFFKSEERYQKRIFSSFMAWCQYGDSEAVRMKLIEECSHAEKLP